MEPSLLTGSKPGILGTPEQLGMARVKGAKRGKRKAAAVTPAGTAAAAPALPPDVLTDIAGRAFELKGCTLAALSRFSAVCVAWRNHLKGLPVVLKFAKAMRPEQLSWLCKTLQPVKEVAFDSSDGSTYNLFLDATMLRASTETLRRVRNVFCSDIGEGSPEALDALPGLSRFRGLLELGLRHAHRGSLGGPCTWLPATLQDLRLDHDPLQEAPLHLHGLPLLRLGALTQLTRLTFSGHYTQREWPDPLPGADEFVDPAAVELPRSLRSLRLQGRCTDPADAAICAYGASCAQAGFHPLLEIVVLETVWLRSRRCFPPWSADGRMVPNVTLLPPGFGELFLVCKEIVMCSGADGRATWQAAVDSGRNPVESVMDMPLPEPPQQLWDLLVQAPSHYQRMNCMCSSWKQSSPGYTLEQNWNVFHSTDGSCTHLSREAFVDYDEWADFLTDVAEDAGFELLLACEPDSKVRGFGLHRIHAEEPALSQENP